MTKLMTTQVLLGHVYKLWAWSIQPFYYLKETWKTHLLENCFGISTLYNDLMTIDILVIAYTV